VARSSLIKSDEYEHNGVRRHKTSKIYGQAAFALRLLCPLEYQPAHSFLNRPVSLKGGEE
jgi:hypothetical protein